MSSIAILRPAHKPRLAPILPFRIRPLITLERCGDCNGVGFTISIRRYMALQRQCVTCGGSGTIVRDDC